MVHLFKGLASSTETKVKNEPLGPYNKELLDILVLSFNPKSLRIIVDQLLRRLTGYMNSYSELRGKGKKVPDMSLEKPSLVLLKTLTVMLYLTQYGSDQFVLWIQIKYIDYLVPLKYVKFHSHFTANIKSKIEQLIRYCEDKSSIELTRQNLSHLRSDLSVPGVKRLNTTNFSNKDRKQIPEPRTAKSLEIPTLPSIASVTSQQ